MSLVVNSTPYLAGHVIIPGSKSHSIRAVFLSLMARGESILSNVLSSEDTQAASNVCRNLGAVVVEMEDRLMIKSNGLPLAPLSQTLCSSDSGVTTHFVMSILGLRENADQPIILDCGEQMRARPVRSLVEALRNLGLTIHYVESENKLPVCISGRLMGGKAEVEGITSQYLSSLLFALPCASGDSEITVKNLQERPYVDMTVHWLKSQAIQFQHRVIGTCDIYKIKGRQQYKNIHTVISGDFSSAAFFIAAAVFIPGEVVLEGLDMNDSQGDKRLVTILKEMGADIDITLKKITIRGGKKLTGMKIDANDIPDLLPILAVVGTFASGKTEIYNAAHARIKETDRIRSMAKGLARMGAKIEEKQDGLTLYQSCLRGAKVEGEKDHRTVMSLSIAGMIADGETVISDDTAINKTLPTFVALMESLGAKMEIKNGVTA